MTEIRDRFEGLRSCRQDIADIFSHHGGSFKRAIEIASVIAAEIENLSLFIQPHTEVVCPECSSVCCINRHSYHTTDDIIFIYALGEQVPRHTPGIDDSSPCQFLGEIGCSIPRVLRPYRCNWYFCSPLLDHIAGLNTVRQYRLFIDLLQKITRERQRLMEEYTSEANCTGIMPDKT